MSESLVDEETGIPPPFFPTELAFDWKSVVNGKSAGETNYEFSEGETVLFRTINANVEATLQLYFNETDAPGFLVVSEGSFPSGADLPKFSLAPIPQMVSLFEVDPAAAASRQGDTSFSLGGTSDAGNGTAAFSPPDAGNGTAALPLPDASTGNETTTSVLGSPIDGSASFAVTPPAGPASVGAPTEEVAIPVGARVEFMVKFDKPGTYTLRRRGWTRGGVRGVEACNATYGIPLENCVSYDQDKIVATITVYTSYPKVNMSLPTTVPPLHQVYTAMEAMPIANTREITMNMKSDFPLFQIPYDNETEVEEVLGYGINNRLLTPTYVHGEIVLGTCEEWTIISDPPGEEHSFHISSNPFLVTAQDGVPVAKPFWRDTLRKIGNSTTIKTCFTRVDPGDLILVHCQAAAHLDVGVRIFFAHVVCGSTCNGETS